MKHSARWCKAVVVLPLLLLPFTASANHGVDAIGAALVVLFSLAVYFTLNIISFFLALRNMDRKSLGMRVFNIIMAAPMLLVAFFLLNHRLGLAIVLLLWTILHAIIIYKSFGSADEENR